MNRWNPSWIRLAGIGLVIVPMVVGLGWREAVRPCDYIAQAGLLLLMFTLPFCTPSDSGFGRPFGLLILAGVLWGAWRLAYFDSVTRNDVPGMGYVFVTFMMGAVSAFIYMIRVWLHRRRSRKAS